MTAPDPEQIDDLMERATKALVGMLYFEAERLALKALHLARGLRDYERLARITMPLQEARRQRLILAHDAAEQVTLVDEPLAEDAPINPGCFLVQPMLVAADARRLRTAALINDIPVAVLCREPMTDLGLQPIVALGEVVVRTKVRPPKNPEKPDKTWFIDAMEALGDAAIDEIDPALVGERLVDAVLARLDAVPDHEKLHQRLAEVARETARLLASEETNERINT